MKQHLDVLCCPVCYGMLDDVQDKVVCSACQQSFPVDDGLINFCPNLAKQSGESYGQKLMEDPKSVETYESVQRKLYVRIMGRAFFGGLSLRYETDYLERRLTDVPSGKVLDLACGSGFATRFLAQRFNADSIIGLDISPAMLNLAKTQSPEVLFLRSSAQQLPVKDNSLAAVVCWDALQAIPNPRKAIQEIGRTLMSGGAFTCFTFKKSKGPYRWVQNKLAHKVGSTLFDIKELETWLNDAGLYLEDLSGPGHTLFFHAKKQ